MNRLENIHNAKYPGVGLSEEEKKKHLYHYTSLESFLKIWTTKSLLFSEASRVNDILESHKSLWSQVLDLSIIRQFQEKVYSYKQISLTMDYDSYIKGCMSRMMWGHYGQKGEGVCIEMNSSKLNLDNLLAGPIKYSNQPLSMPQLPSGTKTIQDIENFILQNKNLFFFTKTNDWAGENEFRIISDSQKFLDITDAIECVYVTSSQSITCQCVEELVKDKVPVKFFHHNISKDWLVPLVTDTRRYRESLQPRTNYCTIKVGPEHAQLTLTTHKADGTIVDQKIYYGEASITPENLDLLADKTTDID